MIRGVRSRRRRIRLDNSRDIVGGGRFGRRTVVGERQSALGFGSGFGSVGRRFLGQRRLGKAVGGKRLIGGSCRRREGREGHREARRRNGLAGDGGPRGGMALPGAGLLPGGSGNQSEGAWDVGEGRPEPIQEGFAALGGHASARSPRGRRPRGLGPRRGVHGEPIGGRCRHFSGRRGCLRGIARRLVSVGDRGGGVGFDRRRFVDEAGVVSRRRMGGDGGRVGGRHDPRLFDGEGFFDGDGVWAPGGKLHDGRARNPFPFDGRRIIEGRDQPLVGGEFFLCGDPDRPVGRLDPFCDRPAPCGGRRRARLTHDRIGLSTTGFERTEGGQRREQPDE